MFVFETVWKINVKNTNAHGIRPRIYKGINTLKKFVFFVLFLSYFFDAHIDCISSKIENVLKKT